ncbi:hypothetical protein [Limoniibacter endophyticus]|uniref:Uncharacterized protein n=1 Tax=Limoniibacter endophyticus TaxID=1565040 RepID=A0A8J3DDV9_9HYPH|nr:hypothetical protein [Limoniibacter endophyticus]GHC61473.1 hypothetical protein GCM10010136_02030 [Limoniibacter endophyticus]
MADPKPTPAMRRALEALASSDLGKLRCGDFYKAMAVTQRGKYLVMSRMEERMWIERCSFGSDGGGFEITPCGLKAIGLDERAEALISGKPLEKLDTDQIRRNHQEFLDGLSKASDALECVLATTSQP